MADAEDSTYVLESGRVLYRRKRKLLLLPPKDQWSAFPQGASWGGWPVPFGWEPAVTDGGQVYFLNHVGQAVGDSLPKVGAPPPVGGKSVRLVSIVPREGNVGFKCSPSSHRVVGSVEQGGAADNGTRGLYVGDEIVKVGGVDVTRVSKEVLKPLLRPHMGRVLVLTVLTARPPLERRAVRVDFEDGSAAVTLELSEDATTATVIDQVLQRRGVKGKSRKLFRLRLTTAPFEPLQWLDQDEPLAGVVARAGKRACIVSVQSLPTSVEELLDYDPIAFAYVVAQVRQWVNMGQIDFVDTATAATLAAHLLAPRMESARVEADRKRWDPTILERDAEELAKVLPISLRVSLEGLRSIKKQVVNDLRSLEAKQLSAVGLQMALLELAVSIGAIGVMRHTLWLAGVESVIGISSRDIHVITDAAHLQTRQVCPVDQILDASVEATGGHGKADAVDAGRIIMSIATASGKRKFVFKGEPHAVGRFARSLTAMYGVAISSKKSLLSDASMRLVGQWLGRASLAGGAPQPYLGTHTVLSVGWNYDDLGGGPQWHCLTLPFTELSTQSSPLSPPRRRSSSPAAAPAARRAAEAAAVEVGVAAATRERASSLPAVTAAADSDDDIMVPPPPLFAGVGPGSQPLREDAEDALFEHPIDPPPPAPPSDFDDAAAEEAATEADGEPAAAAAPSVTALEAPIALSPESRGGLGVAASASPSSPEPRLSSVHMSRLSAVAGVGPHSTADNANVLRDGIELVKHMLGLIKTRLGQSPSRAGSSSSLASVDHAELRSTLAKMWKAMKDLVGAVWEITALLVTQSPCGDDGVPSHSLIDDRVMRREAAEACQTLGRTLEMGLTLPPVELASGTLAEPIVYLKDVALAFLRVLNLLLKMRAGSAAADDKAVSAAVEPFVEAATVTMKMLASQSQ